MILAGIGSTSELQCCCKVNPYIEGSAWIVLDIKKACHLAGDGQCRG